MQPMTKHLMKNALLHPVHAFNSALSSATQKPITFKDDFRMRIRALEFADENNFTSAERRQLNRILSSNVIFFTVVGDGKNVRSMLFVTDSTIIQFKHLETEEVIQRVHIPQGYVIRANSTDLVPIRVDILSRVFESDAFRSWLGDVLHTPKVCSSTILKGAAGGLIKIDDDLKPLRDFFNQPFFGTP